MVNKGCKPAGFLKFYRFFIIVAWLAFAVADVTYAQRRPASTTAVGNVPDDRSPIRIRYPNAEQLRDLQTDRAYQYDRDSPPPDNSVARFLAYVWRRISQFLAGESYQKFWQFVLLAGITALVIYLLTKAEVMGYLFAKRARSTALDYENLAENIHEIDFTAAIDEAIGQRNYRLAVRLLYLQSLKRLTDAGHITYKPDKTNRQYVQELAGSPYHADFDDLTRQFEFVWYGGFPIDESRFAAIQNQFRLFRNRPELKPVN